MTSYEFGDVVLVNFPQSGTTARKQRPGVIVLDIDDADVVVAPVTSRPRFQPGDIQLADLSGTGLIPKPPGTVPILRSPRSKIGTVPLSEATLLKSDIVRPLGRLTLPDRNMLATNWQKLYGDFAS